jgi:hypothetical protein
MDMAGQRRCIGSAKFGIEAHDAPVDDFPSQPSQKDGLGRMCRTHWNQYTTALRKAALARKATVEETPPEPEPTAVVVKGKPLARRRRQAKSAREVEQEPPAA